MPKTPIPVLSDEEIRETASFVVKRFRKFKQQNHDGSAKSGGTVENVTAQQSDALRSAGVPAPKLWQVSTKSPGMPLPPHCNPDSSPRLSQPPVRKSKHLVRSPVYSTGGVLPPAVPCKGVFTRPPTGGMPCPAARPTPRSLAFHTALQSQHRIAQPLLLGSIRTLLPSLIPRQGMCTSWCYLAKHKW